MMMDAELMAILVCPTCRSTLAVDADASRLVCNPCAHSYEVRDGVPLMLGDSRP